MRHIEHQAEVWEERVVIPTYEAGEPDKNPMFLEKRVYQGSSGKVYPLPVIDRISDEKVDRTYRAVFLENDYIRVMVLPELGGRIQRAYDKTNSYDFVYYNEVIKPALVGLCGPWISGGVEFNWPQHHRPTTFSPVEWRICKNADGSGSVELNEVDQMYGTKGKMTITVRPDRAYIEITGRLYNRTALPQTFLWWANPAVAVNENTQSIFPPDVTAVFDHGKRDVSDFPIATGVYYKHDYGAGVDISRYKNIPVPTSYMCAHSDYDFIGGYDYGARAGVLHVADHHISPGKKQWTWGCGDFGQAWDRNLTDANGPYIELMTGMFCDNQPDFAWLRPFEEKTFAQYFMPYKSVGRVKNATTEAVVNLETDAGRAKFAVYVTGEQKDVRVVLTANGEKIYEKTFSLSPRAALEDSAPVSCPEDALRLAVYDAKGRLLVEYRPQKKEIAHMPEAMREMRLPEEMQTVEELYLAGQHLEQYRHATRLPDGYYLEALRRDAGDIRANCAYGLLLLRRGRAAQSEKYFRAAIARMTRYNPNPSDSEAYEYLGLSLLEQGRENEAYDAFYKAAWSAPQQETAFYYLACIACRRGEYEQALEHVERSLVRNGHNLRGRALRGCVLQRLGQAEEAARCFAENLRLDAFDHVSRIASGDLEGVREVMDGRASDFIEAAGEFAAAGMWRQAYDALRLCPAPTATVWYHTALCAAHCGEDVRACLEAARRCGAPACLPNKPEDIAALRFAMEQDAEDALAPYLLGCLWYDRLQYDDAIACWEKSAELNPAFPTVWRNLSIAYYNKRRDADRALACMEKAYALDESDARVLLELDQLYRRMNRSATERFAFLDARREVVFRRDDLYIEYCTLLNLQGRFDEALALIEGRRFHPWEGGEGKVTKQYAVALTQMGRRALAVGDAEKARALLQRALVFPHNLGEGKLEGAKDNDVYYYLGLAERQLDNEEAAVRCFERAAAGDEEPAGMMYYNDQPADLILYQGLANRALGREERARSRFHKLIRYGEKHYYDEGTIDYFAVSLPDLQLFDDDLTARNRVHCEYLIALGSFGLGDRARAEKCLQAVLERERTHQGAALHRKIFAENE